MVRSIYEMPLIPSPKGDGRMPKYFNLINSNGLDWNGWSYGNEPHCLVGVLDVPPAVDATLVADSQVFKLPDNLDTTIGSTSTRNTVRTRLEQDELPGQWVQTTTTYREIVRVVGACCRFAESYEYMGLGPWFSGTVHIASTFSALTAAQQQGIRDTAASLGLDQTIIIGTNTIRDVLKNLADQYVAGYVAGNPLYDLNLSGPL
jgi:hypothetical protein